MGRKNRGKKPSAAPPNTAVTAPAADSAAPAAAAAAPRHPRQWPAIALAFAATAGVGWLDYVTPLSMSFLFFYLAPIGVATWFAGRRMGILFSVLCATVSLAGQAAMHEPLVYVTWNTGVGLAVFLTMALLLDELKRHGTHWGFLARSAPRICITAAFIACVLGGIAIFASHEAVGVPGDEASAMLAKMTKEYEECVPVSRAVLLGSRDPCGPSCIQVVKKGDVTSTGSIPPATGDVDGGPGTRIGIVLAGLGGERNSPLNDFIWHQGRLKMLLENMAAENEEPRRLSDDLAKDAEEFARRVGGWQNWPGRVGAAKVSDKGDWAGFCLRSLNEAVTERDLPRAKLWSAEFASAMLSVADLHRWLEFLIENFLTGLEFQARCKPLFESVNSEMQDYNPRMNLSAFPAGMLTLHGHGNFLEVERQAEQLFQVPKDRMAEAEARQHVTDGSMWVPPRLREVFLKLQEQLSPANRRTWEEAARSPYEHAYMVNMLFRATRGDMVDQLATVLQRFNANSPSASMNELMGVMMYRGHSFGGLEWSDAYQPLLMREAGELRGDPVEAFMEAYKYTYGFYSMCSYGMTVTLRQAIDERMMDCIRATDMMGDIYRESGRARLGHVRWCAGTSAHSVAAVAVTENGQRKVLLLDGMAAMDKPEVWPDAYFHGHAWPHGLENNAPPFSAELYARGLDNYIWSEGYIIRGPDAGTLMRAAIPYFPNHGKMTTEKVFGEAGSRSVSAAAGG